LGRYEYTTFWRLCLGIDAILALMHIRDYSELYKGGATCSLGSLDVHRWGKEMGHSSGRKDRGNHGCTLIVTDKDMFLDGNLN